MPSSNWLDHSFELYALAEHNFEMSPPRSPVVHDVPRVKSVIVKPLPRQSVRIEKAPPSEKKAATVERLVLDGKRGEDRRLIHVRINGRDIDYFHGVVCREDLVAELEFRLQHTGMYISTLETRIIRANSTRQLLAINEMVISNFRGQTMIDNDIMEAFRRIFRTVSITNEVTIRDTCFALGRFSLGRLMECFENFRPKVRIHRLSVQLQANATLDTRHLALERHHAG